MSDPKMPTSHTEQVSSVEAPRGPDTAHEKPTPHIDTKNPEVVRAFSDRIGNALNIPSTNSEAEAEKAEAIAHWTKYREDAIASGKPTGLADRMLKKYDVLVTPVESKKVENVPPSPESQIKAFDETIGNIQAQIAQILGKSYSIFQGGYEIQAANDAISADKNLLNTAMRNENSDTVAPAIQARLLESQKKYIALLEKMRTEKQFNSDPQDELHVQMAYEDALEKLGKSLTPELTTLKGSLESLPRDAEESEKRTARLAFLRAYETQKKLAQTKTV